MLLVLPVPFVLLLCKHSTEYTLSIFRMIMSRGETGDWEDMEEPGRGSEDGHLEKEVEGWQHHS